MTRAEEYAAKIKQLIANAQKLSPEAVAAIEKLLEQANVEVLGKLATLDPGSYSSAQLNNLKRDIARAMEVFRVKATQTVNDMQASAYTMAANDISIAVGAWLGTTASYAALNLNTLRIAQAYTADLVSGLSAEATTKLNAVLQRAFLGGQTLPEIIAQVGKAISGDKFSGIFDEIGDRAFKVATNEIMRVHSIAGQARMKDLATRNSKIKKQWVHLPAARVPRITHLLADGQIVGVDEPFTVGIEQLMFPRDPNGSASNTINCHCISIPYIDDEDLYATAEDRATLEAVGLKMAA